jgi:hypothetical protein
VGSQWQRKRRKPFAWHSFKSAEGLLSKNVGGATPMELFLPTLAAWNVEIRQSLLSYTRFSNRRRRTRIQMRS